MCRLLSWLLGLACMVVAARGFGEQSDSVQLNYSAGEGCPNRAAFVAEVEARTPRARFVTGDARVITVSAHVDQGRARGTLDVGSGAPREFSAESCADVVSALALVTALVIDPDALVTPLGPAATLVPAAAPSAPAAAPALAPSAPAAAPALAAPVDEPSRPAPSTPWQGASPLWGGGVRFDASTGLSDGSLSMFGFSAWIEGGVRLSKIIAPTVRLGGRAAWSPTVTPPDGSARFRLLAGVLDGCPLRYVVGRFGFTACVALELGLLQGTADSAPPLVTTKVVDRAWLALGQSLGAELAVGGPVYLTFMVEIREILHDYNFVFSTNPDMPIANVQGVELAAGLGAGLHFW